MIIFDCDGVLVDSEILSNSIDAQLMSEAGLRITSAELIREYIGQPKAAIWDTIAAEHGITWPSGLVERAEKLLIERIPIELRAVEGVEKALAEIDEPIAVASSSEMTKLRLALKTTGLLEFFDPKVFSASQVARGKPAPDVFLFAAGQCGAKPEDCFVLEDSVAGVVAAKAACMRVAGFVGGLHTYPGHAERLLEAGAEAVIRHMDDLGTALLAKG